jgi:hypothetical protein
MYQEALFYFCKNSFNRHIKIFFSFKLLCFLCYRKIKNI